MGTSPTLSRGHSSPGSKFEEWRETIHAVCGRFNAETEGRNDFAGWACARQTVGFDALDVACNVDRIERSRADARRDGIENYYLILQLDGEAVMQQNDCVVRMHAGDGVLIDSTCASSFRYPRQGSHQLSLHLPRQQLIAHLGFQPTGSSRLCGSDPLSRALSALLVERSQEGGERLQFKRHAVFDLIGALLAPNRHLVNSTIHSDRTFERVCAIARRGARDPRVGVADVAREAGISVRYVQKLFEQRGDSFSQFVHSQRLSEAAALIQRRRVTVGRQSIGQIAECCGFNNLPYFSRAFRRRFGCAPSDYSAGDGSALTCAEG